MDAFAEFLPFLLFLLYAVLQVLRRRKQPEAPPSLPDSDNSAGAPQRQPDLDELARHLEALMTGQPLESAPPPRKPEPRYDPEFQNSEVAVDESASFQHQRHGFGPENPFSEETFERQPAFARRRRPTDATPVYDPHGLKRPAPKPSVPAARWRERLADPKRAREAFVLQTILERPQDRRR